MFLYSLADLETLAHASLTTDLKYVDAVCKFKPLLFR